MLALGACTTLQGAKLDVNGEYAAPPAGPRVAPRSNGGIPFQLTRPEFQAQKDDDGKYSVVITNVPDDNQRYSVRLAPSTLAKIGFTLNWDDNGQLTGINTSTEEQVTPTVVALLGVAANLATISAAPAAAAKAAAPGAMKSADVKSGKQRLLPRQVLTGADCMAMDQTVDILTCAVGLAAGAPLPASLKLPDESAPCSAADATNLIMRTHPFRDVSGKDKGELLSATYANTTGEAVCLLTAADLLKTAKKTYIASLKSNIATAWTNMIPTAGDPEPAVSKAAVEHIEAAVVGADADAAQSLIAGATRLALATPRQKTIKAALELSSDIQHPGPVAQAMKAAFIAAEFIDPNGPSDDWPPGRSAARVARASAVSSGLTLAATLEPKAWLRRRLLDLDQQIATATVAALMKRPGADPTDPTVGDPTVLALRREEIADVGMKRTQDLLDAMRQRLKQLPAGPTGERLSPTSEYVALRAEADRLEGLISAAIESAEATTPADKTAPEVMPPHTDWVAGQCVTASTATKDWIYAEGADAPDYVVVLRRRGSSEAVAPVVSLSAWDCTQ
jgi:hypothetical protein